ncbi:UDP-glucose 4-epimerase GalE [Microbacterium sp. SD291]|uniref:UDP-glucose 4-epimerase GalE n=1 Tax=Microbacterium sp. SD291 TaxID=2782007 RepID=UPI001A957DF7|nr:UDP-glucose 4-epimerase GalE [Microbacterium sp. SD291]MBO0980966.1 UDP-glucose 4-epimerase GalE [Microbacterium sp. SD291]
MRVLLTGGSGFIGSHVAVALAAAGHEPLIVDDLSNSRGGVVERIRELARMPIPALVADVRDEASVSEFLAAHGRVDAVVHLAGLKAVGESVADPVRYYDVNLSSTLAVLRLMSAHGIDAMVFSSSATVYGSAGTMPLAEDGAVGAGIANPYGRTKYMIEEILRDVCAAEPSFRCTALRYFNPVGAHPSGLLGEDPLGVPNNLMPVVAKVAGGILDSVSIFGTDYPTRDGTGERDYVHVQDLARGHVRALEELAPGFDAVNLGTGEPASVLDVIRAYGDASGREIPYRLNARRPGDLAVAFADVEKAARELGWTAELTLADACRDDWRWRQATAD